MVLRGVYVCVCVRGVAYMCAQSATCLPTSKTFSSRRALLQFGDGSAPAGADGAVELHLFCVSGKREDAPASADAELDTVRPGATEGVGDSARLSRTRCFPSKLRATPARPRGQSSQRTATHALGHRRNRKIGWPPRTGAVGRWHALSRRSAASRRPTSCA